MNVKKIFTLFLLIVSCSLFASAQQKPAWEEERDREEIRQRQEAIDKRFAEITGTTPFDLSYFLPRTDNAWFVSITTTGGILGGTRLVAAVNSDGNYLCSAEQDFTNQLIAADVFRPVFQTINGFDFKKYNSYKVKEIEGCKDCAYTTLTFQNANKTYSYSRNTFANAESNIREIYNQILDSAACQ